MSYQFHGELVEEFDRAGSIKAEARCTAMNDFYRREFIYVVTLHITLLFSTMLAVNVKMLQIDDSSNSKNFRY